MRLRAVTPMLARLWVRHVTTWAGNISSDGPIRRQASERSEKKDLDHSKSFFHSDELGWLMGLEPTTTGITILDSTN